MLSEADELARMANNLEGLNPCFSGTCSRRLLCQTELQLLLVLILVLVEHALGD